MIDLHILHTPESDQRLLTNALASAKEAIANSPVPVALHVLLGSPGNPGIKRYSAYRRGNFEWKSRLDSDDELHPDFFKEVAPYLKQGYERIQTTARVHEPPPRNLIVEGVPKHGGLLIRFDWLERQDGMGLKYAYDILIAENPAKTLLIKRDLYIRNSRRNSDFQRAFHKNLSEASKEYREYFN